MNFSNTYNKNQDSNNTHIIISQYMYELYIFKYIIYFRVYNANCNHSKRIYFSCYIK